jgi:DNA-binding response OmpR family regulator
MTLQNTLDFTQHIYKANSFKEVCQLLADFWQSHNVGEFALWRIENDHQWHCQWQNLDLSVETVQQNFLSGLTSCLASKKIVQLDYLQKEYLFLPLRHQEKSLGVLIIDAMQPQQEILLGLCASLLATQLYNIDEKSTQKTEENIAKKEPKSPSQADLNKLRVLVIEDAPSYQIIVTKYLNNVGITPDIASDGKQAFDFLNSKEYDIILLDNQLPDIEGLVIAHTIRTERKLQLPMVMMSAESHELFEQKAIEAGINYVIKKPIQQNKLHELLRGVSLNTSQKDETEPDLDFLRQAANHNTNFIKTMLKVIVTEFEQFESSFMVALRNGNTHEIQLLAHKIKPHVESYKLHTLKNLINEAQTTTNLASKENILENLQKEVQRICIFLKQELDKLQ